MRELTTIAALLATLTGCRHPSPAHPTTDVTSTLKIDGLTIPTSEASTAAAQYHFFFHQPGKSPTEFRGRSITYRVSGREISAGNGAIVVDGESFGSIAGGDRIEIHPDGRVEVNGVMRSRIDERPVVP